MRLVPTVLGALWVLGSSSVVSAQTVESGREAYLEAEFEGAVRAFERVLSSPDLTAVDALESTRYLTALALMLDDEESARRHARAAVALDRDVHAPEGSPPEAEALLRELAAGVEGRAPLSMRNDGEGVVTASLSPAPDLITSLRLRCNEEIEEGAPPSISLEVGSEGSLDCEAEALTEAGASLFSARETFAPRGAVFRARDEAPEDQGADDGAPLWPWIVAGAGVLVAVAVVVTIIAVAASGGSDQAAFGGTRVEGW